MEKTEPQTTARPRVLFLTDSLSEKSENADALIWLAASLNASGAECAIVSFLPCKKRRREQIRALGVPVRFLQFFNLGIKFYAPGLTGTVLLFRPDCVVLCSAAAHLHAGPLSRAFRGLRLASIVFGKEKRAGILVRLARRHCAVALDDIAFPSHAADETEKREFVEKFIEKIFENPR